MGDERKRKHVGPYELRRALGKGAFGTVKLGVNIFTGEKVAVKIINLKNATSDWDRYQIKREREILLRLKHPHIVNLLKVVDDEKRGKTFMIFEYIQGGELFDYIVANGRLAEEDARKFMREIVSAIEYCHSLLIVHRDLKPENLLLDRNLSIKISDFGLSNIMEPGKKFNTFCGSLHYACPEILRGETYLGPGVDIWSLGIILYCLVVGRQPWDGANAEELMKGILVDGIEIPEGVSDECVNLILSMLRVNEQDRIPISKIRNHPWILEGYNEPPPSHLPSISPITEIDDEVVEELKAMGFLRAHEDPRKELMSDDRSQLIVTYNLLLKNKLDRQEAEVAALRKQSKERVRKRRERAEAAREAGKAKESSLRSSLHRSRRTKIVTKGETSRLRSSAKKKSRRDSNTSNLIYEVLSISLNIPHSSPPQNLNRSSSLATGGPSPLFLSTPAEPGDSSRERSATVVSRTSSRPIFSIKDIASGVVRTRKRTQSSTSSKSRKGSPRKREKSPDRSRQWMTDSSFFEPPEEDHGMGAASERSVTDSDQSMEAVLKYSDNPATVVPRSTSNKPPDEMLERLKKVLKSLNCKYKKGKSKFSLLCTSKIAGDESIKFLCEIVAVDGGTLLRRGSRGIGMKRVTGDIWQYKQLYERIVSHYEATG